MNINRILMVTVFLALGSVMGCSRGPEPIAEKVAAPTPVSGPVTETTGTIPPSQSVAIPTAAWEDAQSEPVKPQESPFRFSDSVKEEEVELPKYTLEIHKPVMEGETAQSGFFNQEVDALYTRELEGFLSDVEYIEPARQEHNPEIGSTFWADHQFTFTEGSLVSLQYNTISVIAGAAHPTHYMRTLNFDMAEPRILTLGDLFLPYSEYLGVISLYCIDELTRMEALTIPQGATPLLKNYEVWNLMPDGLRITFNPYQVAPYAGGSPQVLIPYDVLREDLDPQGPLAEYLDL